MGRPKTYDRSDVLERAGELFWEKGYEGAHLQELVEVTGINRFSLYREFGGKAGLFEEALGHYIAELAELRGELEREPRGVANVRRFFARLIDHGFKHGCLAMNTIREKHVVGPGAWEATETFVVENEAALRRNLAAARRDGVIAASTNVSALARFLVTVNIGMLTHGIVETSRSKHRAMLTFLDRILV